MNIDRIWTQVARYGLRQKELLVELEYYSRTGERTSLARVRKGTDKENGNKPRLIEKQ